MKAVVDQDTTTVGNSCGLPHASGAGTWNIDKTQLKLRVQGKLVLIDGDIAIAGDGCSLITNAISQSKLTINGIPVATDNDKCENGCHPASSNINPSTTKLVIE
jgi:hypothetical protein